MIYKVLLLANIITSVAAQFMLKFGMKRIGVIKIDPQILSSLKRMALSPFLWLAIIFFGLSFVFYAIVLSKVELSRSYPIALLGAVVLISLISILFFQESITFHKIVGLTLCTGGIVFLLF